MMFKRFIFGCLLSSFLATAGANADEPNTPPLRPPAAEVTSVHIWGQANKSCAEWTNGCAVCARDEAGDFACSTPGIACQPKAVACSRQIQKKP
jgi:hypothetical protein